MNRLLAPALALLLLAPLAHGQDHNGDAERMILLHDGEPEGHAVAGSLAHFGFALVDAHGAPVVHQNSRFLVEQDGRVLFETEDAHEYDGLFGLELTLPRAGPYTVDATRTSGDGGPTGAFTGEAVGPSELEARVLIEAPTETSTFFAETIRVTVVNATGEILPHSDAIVEVRRASDGYLVQRFHGHTHERGQEFLVAFPQAGEYELHVTGYNAFPTPDRAGWRSVAATHRVTVTQPPDLGIPVPPAAGPASGDVLTAGDGPVLHLITDPTSFAGGAVDYPFGTGTLLRFNGFVVNATEPALVQHVDFRAELRGPTGILFQSETLHEYDGHFEFVAGALPPGDYRFTLDASRGDAWAASVQKTIRVLPPALPLTAGAYRVEMAPVAAAAGEPAELAFALVDDAGRPLSHGEVDVTILPADGGAQVASFKLHTHGSGEMSARYAFPTEGEWLVRATPSILEAKTAIAAAGTFPVTVTSTPPENDTPATEAAIDEVEVPAPPVALLLAAVALAGLSGSRRAGSRDRPSRTRGTRPGSSGRAR